MNWKCTERDCRTFISCLRPYSQIKTQMDSTRLVYNIYIYIWHSKNSRDKRKRGLSQQQCQLFTVWYELAYQHMSSATNCNAVQWVFNEPTTEGSTLCNIKHQWYKLPMYACSMQPARWAIEWLSQCFWLKSSNFQPVQCNQRARIREKWCRASRRSKNNRKLYQH